MTDENLTIQPDPVLPQPLPDEISETTDAQTPDLQPADEQPSGDPTKELIQLIAEAEERGYRRGLNQQLREALNSPGLFEDLARRKKQQTAPQPQLTDPLTSRFLTSIRPGIWD